jgi:hypothetical protein
MPELLFALPFKANRKTKCRRGLKRTSAIFFLSCWEFTKKKRMSGANENRPWILSRAGIAIMPKFCWRIFFKENLLRFDFISHHFIEI